MTLSSLITAAKEHRLLPFLWGAFRDTLYRIADPVLDALVHTEPLPGWANVPLILLGALIWAFALSLNWWADSTTYVVTSLIVLGALGCLIIVPASRGKGRA